MAKDLEVSILLDFYGEMLTDKQKDVIDLYYNEDLSLAEIAEHEGISRQGVRDNIKRGEYFLLELESKIGYVRHYREMQQLSDRLIQLSRQVGEVNERYAYNNDIKQLSQQMEGLLQDFWAEDSNEEER